MDAAALRVTIDLLAKMHRQPAIDKVVAIEARGFILGGAVAHYLGVGFVPIRKRGKLPGPTFHQVYGLEYGVDAVEIHRDAISSGDRVLLVDDLLATGGTAEAAIRLIESAGGKVEACSFIIDLQSMDGRKRIESLGASVHSLVTL
jgi:adenine phosphoribosyltransferase